MRLWSRRAVSNVYLWLIVALGGAALLAWEPNWRQEPGVLLTLVVLFALAEYFPIRIPLGATAFSFPMAAAAWVLYGMPGAAWVAAVGIVLANFARRRAWRVVCFNGAQFALAAASAGAVVSLWPGFPPHIDLGHGLGPLVVFQVVYYALNNALMDLLLWLRLKHYRWSDWWAKNRYEALSAAVSLLYSALMFGLAPQNRGHDPLALTFFFLPLLSIGGVTYLVTNLSRSARQLATLLEVSTLTTSSRDLAEAFDLALSHVDSFMDYRYAALYLLEGEELAVQAVRGIRPEHLAHPRLALGEGITGWVARRSGQAVVANAAQDPRNAVGEGLGEDAQALVAVPLIGAGGLIGVLTVGKERSHSVEPQDVRVLTILASLLAAIVQSARLAEEREQRLLSEERIRLARDIHDGLAQSLAGALLQMDHLERLMEAEPRKALPRLQALREHLRESLVEVRRSILKLRPSPLEALGLVAAVRQEVERLAEKRAVGEPEVRLDVRGSERRLSSMVEEEVFRIAQEGLWNAWRHAGAREVAVLLQFAPDRLRLSVRDDGCGFSLADAVRRSRDRVSFGLAGISERAERLGAQLEVESRPGEGTRLTLEVPLAGE